MDGEAKAASLRPQKIALLVNGATRPAGAIVVDGTIAQTPHQGATRRIDKIDMASGPLVAAVPAASSPAVREGERIAATFSRDALHLMDEL